MKFLSKKKILTQEMRDRVKREIEYLSFLRHPHIIKLSEPENPPN
jgi:carbon catabolite-derepressing protein kinase